MFVEAWYQLPYTYSCDVEYCVVDTDFKQLIDLPDYEYFIGERSAFALCYSVIEIYEEKKLNVPSNLFLAFRWYCQFDDKKAIKLMDKNLMVNKKFEQYYEDVEKYFILL